MSKSLIKILGSIFIIIPIILISYSYTTKKGEVVTFDTSISEDATPDVLARIMKADKKPISTIQFEKGTYHFYPDKAYETFVQITNHDNTLNKTAFPLFNFKNLTIDGQGATFIFHGKMIPFLIDGCKNITIKNVSIDWENSFHSEALIVANDEKNKTFDIQISNEYPYEIRNGELIFVKQYYEHNIGQSILYNPKRKAITFNTEKYTPVDRKGKSTAQSNLNTIKYKYRTDVRAPGLNMIGKENKLISEEIKPGLVRIYHHKKKLPPVGNILTCKGSKEYGEGNRLAPAFRVIRTDGFNAKNVNVHHASGMGLIAENSSDLILDGFNVTPSQGRMVSTTADATHFVGCRGKVVLKNCTFNNQLDDATNVHGTYEEVIDIIDEYTVGVRIGHYQQEGFFLGKPNDKLGIVRLEDSFFPYGNLTIKEVTTLNGRYHIIKMNEKLPKELKVGDLLENLDGYPDLLVENCTISNNRARGLLISNPKNTVIRNNYFHTEMEAILIPVESGFWYESGNAANVVITGNTFQDCQHSGFNRGVIRFATDDDNENIAFKNIEITNNKFNQFDNLILQITNADGVKIEGNTITNSGNFEQLNTQNPAIRVNASKHITFKNNDYSGKATEILETDKASSNLEFN